MKILIVEDDEITASALVEALSAHHYTVEAAADGRTGLQLAQAYEYDLIVLDIILPGLDGMTLCRHLRSQGQQMPILLLSAKDSSTERVKGLEAGADDYVVKPYNLPELIARIRALLRRGSSTLSNVLTWEELQLDLDASLVTYRGNPLHLTPKEYSLLELFLRNPLRTFSRSVILDRIWSSDEFPGEEAVTTQIKGLRQKLKAAGMTVNLIETVYGLGYRLKAAPETEQGVHRSADAQERGRTGAGEISSSISDQSEAQAKVMAVVQQMWEEFKHSLPEKLDLFEQVRSALASGSVDSQLLFIAHGEAHRLIGTLGCFGLMEGSKVAREIEQLLKSQTALGPAQARQLQKLVGLLKQTLEKPPFTTTATPVTRVESTQMLVIDDDTVLAKRIEVEAKAWGLQVEVARDLTAARKAIAYHPPDVILLDLTFPDTAENGFTLLSELAHQKPKIPVLVFTGQNQLSSRIEAARLGAYTFLHKPIAPAQLLKAANEALSQTQSAEARVMIVDDDPQVLALLRSILQPWGLQVTTLEDPQRFWEILEAVTPDLLILDVKMPEYSGIELCQVVRNDSRWSTLPILFLSAHTDTQTVQQVFTVGGDDYINKPIVESELIARVLNRLERKQQRRNHTY